MFDNIYTQILLTGEKIKVWAQWAIPVGVSVAAIIISLKRNNKKDHEEEHRELKKDCEKLIEKMELTLIKQIDEKDAANWRAHGEMREQFEFVIKQTLEHMRSMDHKIDILLGK